MIATALLTNLRGLGVELWADGERLRYRAPKGALTPTLRAQLAAHKAEIMALLRRGNNNTGQGAPPIRPVARDGELPLSFAQERLWFLDQLEPGNPAYNVPAAMRIKGPFDVALLRRALTEIVSRHEVLRTTFATVDGWARQIIDPAMPSIDPVVVDISKLPETQLEERAEQLVAEEARRPFDLARGPLIRVTLLRLNAQDHIVLLTMHHIISDGWSMNVLVWELSVLYTAYSAGEPSPLPELKIQYADYAVWQREWLQGEALQAQLDYWKQRLSGRLPVLKLPTDHPRLAAQTFRGARHSLMFPASLSEALKALGREEGATLFMTLLAVFKTLLFRYTWQDDIIVGSQMSGRNHTDTELLIGFFANTLVMRTDLSGDPTFREALSRVREVTLGAYAHQDLPFKKLVEALQPERDLSRNPLFQVTFDLQHASLMAQSSFMTKRSSSPAEDQPQSSLSLNLLPVGTDTSKFDLMMTMTETEQGLTATFEYSTDLFEAATIERMAEHFQTLAESIAAHPDQRLSEFSMLTEETLRQMLVEWNDTQTAERHDRPIHQLFEAQVARTPDTLAVIFEDQQLSYAELNRR
ncbi:MAG TPA: condensation domain-containing protein, partial [Pyrinomonadaceae bacterium]